jgi:TRAP-type C4-dicarboxylate transport system permease small subunit
LTRLLHGCTLLFRTLEAAAFSIAVAATLLIVAVTCGEVVVRYLFASSLSWSYPLIDHYLMPAALLLGLASCQKHYDHIAIEGLVAWLPDRLRRMASRLATVSSALISIAIAWYGLKPTIESIASDARVDAFAWPIWPTYIMIPISFVLLFGRLLLQLNETDVADIRSQEVVATAADLAAQR